MLRKTNNSAIFFYFCLLVMMAVVCPQVYAQYDSTYFNSPPSVNSSIFNPSVAKFPSFGAVPTTQKFKTTINSMGIIGENTQDPLSGRYSTGYIYPLTANINYLYAGGLWVGGIVGNDTLVTSSFAKNVQYNVPSDSSNFNYFYIKETYPEDAYHDLKTTMHYPFDDYEVYHTQYVDTFVGGFINLNRVGRIHHYPLDIKITQKTYVKDISPYRNIMLLDFTITNTGDRTIKNGYAGYYLDGDICGNCIVNGFTRKNFDDMAGSIRDLGLGYMYDNDGDPVNILSFGEYSPIDAIAIKAVKTYPATTDTTFNWWADYSNNVSFVYDYGPRKKAVSGEPYQSFGPLISGTPPGNSAQYHMMINNEWDYDQYQTKVIPLDDTTWQLPVNPIYENVAYGSDSKMLLSLGSFDLQPDSSVRYIFALFAGDFLHINAANYINLLNDNFSDYGSSLYLGFLKQNAAMADLLTAELIDPQKAPLGLKAIKFDHDSTTLSWDRWVFPDITGYNVMIREIDTALLFAQYFPYPGIRFDDLSTPIRRFFTTDNKISIGDLTPGRTYMAVYTHQLENEESFYSNQAIINSGTKTFKRTSVETEIQFTHINYSDNTVSLRWLSNQELDTKYYKIYKTIDSTRAYNRFYPFVHNNPLEVPYNPQECLTYDYKKYCYYEMLSYDTVSSDVLEYIDNSPHQDAYYWISSVNSYDVESYYSPLIETINAKEPKKDVLVVYGSSSAEMDYAYADSIENFYTSILEGYDYDFYHWEDTNLLIQNCVSKFCAEWEDLSNYELIIIEEFPSPQILIYENEANHKLFTRLVDLGRTVAYFGLPPGDNQIFLNTYLRTIDYQNGSFSDWYLGLDSTALIPYLGVSSDTNVIDTLAGFQWAEPTNDSLPILTLGDKDNILKTFYKSVYNTTDNLPFTPAFYPDENVEVIYNYRSLYPETSQLENMPVGIVNHRTQVDTYTFGFHLWAIQSDSARSLIDYIMKTIDYRNNPPSTLPESFSLKQNYPNPFNSGTRISFDLPVEQVVTLEIFNILGQKVRQLIDQQAYPAGFHLVEWDGKNSGNKPSASGIYFYRLSSDSYQSSKKMIFIK